MSTTFYLKIWFIRLVACNRDKQGNINYVIIVKPLELFWSCLLFLCDIRWRYVFPETHTFTCSWVLNWVWKLYPGTFRFKFRDMQMHILLRDLFRSVGGPCMVSAIGRVSKFQPIKMINFTVAPLCYIHEKVEDIYFILRSMYLKYWCRLHRISSNPQGIVSLSILFERLLQRQEPELWIHCLNNNIQP